MSNRIFDYALAQEASMASSVPGGGDPDRVNYASTVPAFAVTWDVDAKMYMFARTLVVAPGGLSVKPKVNVATVTDDSGQEVKDSSGNAKAADGVHLNFNQTYYCHIRYSSTEKDLLAYIDETETPTSDNNSFPKPWDELEEAYTAIDVMLATIPKWNITDFNDTVVEQHHVGVIFAYDSKHKFVPFDVYPVANNPNDTVYYVYTTGTDLYIGETVVPVSVPFDSLAAGSDVRCCVYKSGSEGSSTYEATLYTGAKPSGKEIVSDFAVASIGPDGYIDQVVHGAVVMPEPGSGGGGETTMEDKGPWHIVTGTDGSKSTADNWCMVGSKMVEFGSVTISGSGYVLARIAVDSSSTGVTYETSQGIYGSMDPGDSAFYVPIYKISNGEVEIDFRNTPTFSFMDLFGL